MALVLFSEKGQQLTAAGDDLNKRNFQAHVLMPLFYWCLKRLAEYHERREAIISYS